MALIDQKEIASIIAKEFYSQFITLDGLNSGVPTRTTPTLTPTTLRNIEQTFIELQCEGESHQNEARFVPPLVNHNQYLTASDLDQFNSNNGGSSPKWHSSSLSQSSSDSNRPTPPLTPASGSDCTTPGPQSTRRNMGGRKPNKANNITPEEEERRVLRRERNKMAAARCRKRRVDHTNQLLDETTGLEQKKQLLQNEILQLQNDRDELQFILENHRACCRLQHSQISQQQQNTRAISPPDIKPYVYSLLEKTSEPRVKTEMVDEIPTTLEDDLFPPPAKKLMLNTMAPSIKANRPSSLNVPTTFNPANKTTNSVTEVAGVPITTPSTGIPFNFDSLMDGGTGLTPVQGPLVPSCSSQQRNIPAVDLSSPDANGPRKLVSL